MSFHLYLPTTKARSVPKRRDGPTADSLRAAAAQLDRINSLAAILRISRFKELLSGDEEDDYKGDDEDEGSKGEDEKHPGTDDSRRASRASKATLKQWKANSLTPTSAITRPDGTMPTDKRKKQHLIFLSSDDERKGKLSIPNSLYSTLHFSSSNQSPRNSDNKLILAQTTQHCQGERPYSSFRRRITPLKSIQEG